MALSPFAGTVPVRSPAQRAAILVTALLQVLLPVLPSLGFGEPIGERSDDVRTLITPAGWAFSIWGPLYAGSLLYTLYQLLPAQRDSALLDRIGWASAGAFLGNALWALYTQFSGLSFVSALIIVFTLLCLLSIYRTFARWEAPFRRGEKWLVVIPLSALAAWLTAATIVNISASLNFHGVESGEAAPIVGAAVVLVGGIIASAAIWFGRGNPYYALVFLWALAAIFAVNRGENIEILIAAILSAIAVAVSGLIGLSRNRLHWFGAAAA